MLRIAHLSDPHFSHITYNLNQFFSKRWLGNCNLILYRQKIYQTNQLIHLPELLHDLKVEATVITGDLATTSLDEEFQKAQAFVTQFNMPVYLVPGNHDCYTRGAAREGRFYRYFPSADLQSKGVTSSYLGKNWHWVGIDSSLATSLIFSNGLFSDEMEGNLDLTLQKIPQDHHVVIGNHFPLLTTNRPRHDLIGAEKLQKVLHKYPQVKLYLHGHDHCPYIVATGQPLVFNSGSCTHTPDGRFYLFDLYAEHCLVRQYLSFKDGQECRWKVEWEKTFPFTH